MGALSSCFHVPDVQDDPAANNSVTSKSCLCPKCLFQRFMNKHRNIFRLGQMRVSSPKQQLQLSNSELVSNNSSSNGSSRAVEGDESEVSKKDTFPSPDDEDVCPTCLEDYTEENPKIIAKCSHHYHLSCIYEWMERSEKCPVCGELMLFDE